MTNDLRPVQASKVELGMEGDLFGHTLCTTFQWHFMRKRAEVKLTVMMKITVIKIPEDLAKNG